MRFQIISDTHLEFHRDKGKYFCENIPVLTSTLVIAGDFATNNLIISGISILAKRFENVIYVCGNHEYYGAERKDIHNNMMKLKKRFPNFYWLDNGAVTIEGQKFIGGTMWFSERPDNFLYESLINDFSYIYNFRKWVYDKNRETINFFKNNMDKGCVVITHHAPCSVSTSEEFKGDKSNRFYICDQSELIREKKPAFWIHGHMHQPVSYWLYDTRVESNPFGYKAHERTPPIETFSKVVEI